MCTKHVSSYDTKSLNDYRTIIEQVRFYLEKNMEKDACFCEMSYMNPLNSPTQHIS